MAHRPKRDRRLALLIGACLLAGSVHARTPQAAAGDPVQAALQGEFALQSGELDQAAAHYLDAARAASDPVLAERATRIALLADADALARDALALWTRLDPEQSQPQQVMATTLALRAGQARPARNGLRSLLREGDDGWQQALGVLMAGAGKQPKLVRRLLADVVDDRLLPDRLQAWLGFGGMAQRLGERALVERIVAEVVRRYPDDPRVSLLHAQQLREADRQDEARKVLAQLEQPARLSQALRLSLAGEYEALGDSAAAARVLGYGPQDERILALRAAMLDKAKDKDGLAALYEEARRDAANPDLDRRLLLGQIAEILERHAEALDWYNGVGAGDQRAIARLRSATVLHAMGRKAEAWDAIRLLQGDAALAEGQRRDAYLLEAELRLKDKDAHAEADAFARGLAAFEDDPVLLYARALMWERRDDIPRAEADFRRILVVDPEDVNALNALGYTLTDRTNRHREALSLIQRALVAEPDSAPIIDSYGWVLFRLGRNREALEQLRRAYALQKDPEIATHVGHVLWVLGQREEARQYFEEARKLDLENRALQRTLQELGL